MDRPLNHFRKRDCCLEVVPFSILHLFFFMFWCSYRSRFLWALHCALCLIFLISNLTHSSFWRFRGSLTLSDPSMCLCVISHTICPFRCPQWISNRILLEIAFFFCNCTCMYHSCVTLGYREGNAAPAFVPNRKQTHKRVEEGLRRRGGKEEGERKGRKVGKTGGWGEEVKGKMWEFNQTSLKLRSCLTRLVT